MKKNKSRLRVRRRVFCLSLILRFAAGAGVHLKKDIAKVAHLKDALQSYNSKFVFNFCSRSNRSIAS